MNNTAQETRARACPVCSSLQAALLFVKEDRSFAQCPSCRLIYQDPLAAMEGNQDFYKKDYYEKMRERTPHIQKARLFLYRKALRECGRYRQTSRLLDIGSGYGDFLRLAEQEDWETWGIEPSSEASKAAGEEGLRVLNQTVETVNFPSSHFDVITLWNVIDCFSEPVVTLGKIYDWLAPGGLLLIRTPNTFFHRHIFGIYSVCRPFLKRLGWQKEASVFLKTNYERETLEQLLSKAGLSEIQVRNGEPTRGDPYAHFAYGGFVSLVKRVIYGLAQGISFLTGHRMLVGSTLMVRAGKGGPEKRRGSAGLRLRIFAKSAVLHVLAVLGYLLGLPLWWKRLGRDQDLRILLFHSIDRMKQGDMNVRPDQFKSQLDFLTRRYSILPLSEIVDRLSQGPAPGRPQAAITFDDGYEDNFLSAYPVLKKKKLPAAIFLLTGESVAGRQASHLFENSPDENRLLQWDEVRAMAGGGVTFGSHGTSHSRLKNLSSERLVEEISGSKQKIESAIGAPVRFFSYPYGTSEDFDETTKSRVREAGYEAAFSAAFGTNRQGGDRFALKRIGIEASDTLFTFKAKLNGALGLLSVFSFPPLRRFIRWLDRSFLRVSPGGSPGKPSLLLVSVDFPPHTDGVSTISRELAFRIAHRGPEVVVIGPSDRGDREFDRAQPYRVLRLPGYSWGYFRFIPILLGMTWVVLRQGVRKVFAMNIAYGGVLVWALSFLRPLEYLIFSYGYEFEKVRKIPLARRLYLSIYGRARKVVACSELVRRRLTDFGVNPEKCVVLYPAVDLDRFHPLEAPAKYLEEKQLAGKRLLLTVGRLIERKGHDQVLRALPGIVKDFPDVLYCIVGIGAEEKRLREQIRELGLENHVRLMGKVPEEELTFLYNACEIFVMPSREIEEGGHIEGFGIVYLEANACGKPVIGGRSGGIGEAIRDGETGFLVNPARPEEIAEKIHFLLSSPDEAQRLGRQGLRWVRETFDWDHYTQEAYQLLAGNPLP